MSGRIVRLDPREYRRTPWKNGGGVTIDIADAYAPGTEPRSWSGVLWRLGRTQIVAPGPFSDLSGYDRILTVIGGRGLWLDRADAPALDVREPFRPVRFRGEDRIVSRLEVGPVAVLNLIADRQKYEINLTILSGAGARPLSAEVNIAYGLENSVLAIGERHEIAADAALRIDGGGRMLKLEGGHVALATINPL